MVYINSETFHGLDSFKLGTHFVHLVVVPSIGGRIISLNLGDYDFFFQNSNLLGKLFTPAENFGDGSLLSWKNYGGCKTWPAPQGWNSSNEWPGPPDPILDSGFYNSFVESDGTTDFLKLVSAKDHKTGLQISKQISLIPDSSKVSVNHFFSNISKVPVKWSIWDVAQLDCSKLVEGSLVANDECTLTIPTEDESADSLRMIFGEYNEQFKFDPVHKLLKVHFKGLISKVGVTSEKGWIAFNNRREQKLFAILFAFDPSQIYPDSNSSVECWIESPGADSPIPINSPGFILEAEILGPYTEILPYKTSSFSIEWGLCEFASDVTSVNALGVIGDKVFCKTNENFIHIIAEFGVFYTGYLIISLRDNESNILYFHKHSNISPLKPVFIDHSTSFAPGIRYIDFDFYDNQDHFLGTLHRIPFK